jgi:hypothetical protein
MANEQLEIPSEKVSLAVVEPQPEISMLRLAIEKGAGIDTIERLVALQEKNLARQAETEFNQALNRVQSKIQRIAPDLENTQKHSKYASYAAIDRVIRPIYATEGFSLSFTHAECSKPNYIRVICWVRLGAHKEPYQVDWPVDTQGPKGGDVMTATQATGASDSYAKRYLVKDIFNIAIGEDDTDGNAVGVDAAEVKKNCDEIARAKDSAELKFLFTVAFDKAREIGDRAAMSNYILVKDARKKELANDSN